MQTPTNILMRNDLGVIENEQMNVVEIQNGLIQIFFKGLGAIWEIDRHADGVVELRTYKDGLLMEAMLFANNLKKVKSIESKFKNIQEYWASKEKGKNV
jgi:hypothetical protein